MVLFSYHCQSSHYRHTNDDIYYYSALTIIQGLNLINNYLFTCVVQCLLAYYVPPKLISSSIKRNTVIFKMHQSIEEDSKSVFM